MSGVNYSGANYTGTGPVAIGAEARELRAEQDRVIAEQAWDEGHEWAMSDAEIRKRAKNPYRKEPS